MKAFVRRPAVCWLPGRRSPLKQGDSQVWLQFLGSGDAFGSGGRFNMCMLVESESVRFLLDCGASSLIAMKHFKVSPNSIDTILITHCHGTTLVGYHFLFSTHILKTSVSTNYCRAPGLHQGLFEAMEVLFPGSSDTTLKFDLRILELEPRVQALVNHLVVTPYVVHHATRLACFALRVEVDGHILTYSGDAEWSAELAEAAYEADLFVCEAYFYEKEVKSHLNFKTLEKHLPKIRPKRLILTHMSNDMLGICKQISYEAAEDGKIVEF